MKKILVIMTGGTIGSFVEEKTINIRPNSYHIIKLFCKKHNIDENVFEVVQPMSTLSENIVPNDLLKLYKFIKEINFENYKGIILTHGTDTLPYTSSFLGILLNNIPIPMYIVSSNFVLTDVRSNGLINFKTAFNLINSNEIERNIFVVYKNREYCDIFLSTRLNEADSYNDIFTSFGENSLGYYNNKLILNNNDIALNALYKNNKEIKLNSLDKKVLFIKNYVGLDYDNFNLNNVDAVVHYLYHSATGCTKENEYSVLKFIEKAKSKNIDFYVSSFKPFEDNYITTNSLLNSGAIPLYNISPIASYIKTLICINQENYTKQEFMKTNFNFEII